MLLAGEEGEVKQAGEAANLPPNYQNKTQFIKLFRNIISYSVTVPVVFSIFPIGVYSGK